MKLNIKPHILILSILSTCSSVSTNPDTFDRLQKIGQLAKLSIMMPYTITQLYLLHASPELSDAQWALNQTIPPAEQTYKELNSDPNNPFVMSIGTSMSQTEHTDNIIHPTYLSKLLQKKSKKQKSQAQWLKDRWGYVVASTPNISCNNCKLDVLLETTKQDHVLVDVLIKVLTNNTTNSLTFTQCPWCNSTDIIQKPKSLHIFTNEKQEQFKKQLQTLGVFDQAAAKQLPPYRISLEIADMINHDGAINADKLKAQAAFVQNLQNPLIFMHHYANPQCKPHLFEHKEDITWFAAACAQCVAACPNVTHVCPISQIMGFGLQVARQKMLPPFSCTIDQNQFLQNIIDAQVAASRAMKAVNPKLKVLVSHQWKPMKPMHSFGDPRHALECLICTIADRMYNQTFVQLLQKHSDSFDGIALSVYPALYFNGTTPCGNNCSGTLDPQAALEAIVKIHEAFPTKEIHIVETGCNSADPEIKKQFVDMTLYVCKLARNLGIPVKSCYFWGHTNESYFEWNKTPGTSFFGPFDGTTPESINEYGKYLQHILQTK